ncbi:secretin N-terminal domain-containing protein [Oceanithermus sp.]
MKRLLALVVLVLGLALAGTLPQDPRFDVPVTLRTGPAGMSLPAVLEGAARSVNLTPLLKDVPDVTIKIDWVDKPFRQLWDLLITTYGEGNLDYALLDNDVILVAPPEVVQQALGKPAEAPPAEAAEEQPAEPVVRKFYQIPTGDPAKVAEFLNNEVEGIVATVVPGQRVIAVRGTEAQQEEVQRILAQIIAPPQAGPPIYQKTFRLSNAKATEVAKVIAEALKARQAAAQAGGEGQEGGNQAAAAAPAVNSELSITADERTNTLIVTGTAKQIEMVEDLVKKLDFPVQQVNVQVRIQEVSQTLVQNLGLKWNTISGGNLVASIVDEGLSLIFDATRSLASLNIVATLEALEKQGLSRTVNDSNITVLNNGEGMIQSGATIFITRVVGDKVERVPYDVGVIVKVTPQITADGEIVLHVSSEVSDIKERNPVTGDIDVVSKQSSDTTLRLKDGDTAVLGGLIQTKRNETTQGVPVLMHIPILGNLFKQTSVDNTDTELIMVITANILNDQNMPRPKASGGK